MLYIERPIITVSCCILYCSTLCCVETSVCSETLGLFINIHVYSSLWFIVLGELFIVLGSVPWTRMWEALATQAGQTICFQNAFEETKGRFHVNTELACSTIAKASAGTRL